MKTMIKTTRIFLSCFIMVLVVIATSCSAEDGKDGVDGMDGEQGPPGENGNANVIYSEWAYLQYATRDTIIDGSHLKVNHITAPEVTQEILDNGFIMVYMKYASTVYALPYISDAGGKPNEINFRSDLGKIFITRFAFDDSGSINIAGSLQFRYILIPGGMPDANAQLLDITDYNMVRDFYGLKH